VLGTEPHPLVWEGRLTLLAGCTAAIDRYAAHADALGSRWLAYRTPPATAPVSARGRVAQRTTGVEQLQHRQAAAQLAARIIHTAGERARTLQPGDRDDELLDRILDVAQVVCLGRASVPRHGYGKREIDGLPEVELPPRLAKQLTQLARCLATLGLDPPRTLWLVTHAGLSSMPQLCLRVLQVLAGGEALSVSEVARRAQAHRHPTRFTLEELQAVGSPTARTTRTRRASRLSSVGVLRGRTRPWSPALSLVTLGTKCGAHPPARHRPPEIWGGGVGATYTSCQAATCCSGDLANTPDTACQ